MHRHGIVHRDLKLENWLMQTPGDTTAVMLIDFGLSKHFTLDQNMQQAVGSTYYVAPGDTKEKSCLGSSPCTPLAFPFGCVYTLRWLSRYIGVTSRPVAREYDIAMKPSSLCCK